MNSIKIKAFLITALIFGSIAYFLFGNAIIPDFSKINFFDNLFTKEEVKSSTKKKRRRSITNAKTGSVMDNYKGVDIYYNGIAGNVFGRHVTDDGYNLGLKYQCVEFAKRFYYEIYRHKMPDSYGHAKDFYDPSVSHAKLNQKRGMIQYRNRHYDKPKVDDLCIIGPGNGNNFGHLFIITKVTDSSVEFVQQNGGATNPSRGTYQLVNQDGTWNIKAANLVGWLRMP